MNIKLDFWKEGKLTSGEKVNTGRQLELDVARALAVIFMVFVHVQMTFSSYELSHSFFGGVVDFMGGIPAAPVFMFLMGVGFLYTSNSNHKVFLYRGLSILLLGYLLNVLRDVIPELLDYVSDSENESVQFAIEGLIDVDILQFAGVTMLFWGVVKKFKLPDVAIAAIGITAVVANFFLLDIKANGYLVQAISGLIWGSSEYSEFPFLTWIAYPLLGYFFAQFLVRCKNKDQFYRLILIVSIPALLLCAFVFNGPFQQDLGLDTELSYYHHNLFANVVYGIFCLLWISLIYFSLRFIPDFLISAFKRWSKNVTEIYFIHWVLIAWFSWIFYEYRTNLFMYLVLTICIFLFSDVCASFLKKRNMGLK